MWHLAYLFFTSHLVFFCRSATDATCPGAWRASSFFDPYRMRPGMPMHGMMPGMPMVGPGSAHPMQMMPPQ